MHGNMGLWEVIRRLKFPDREPDYHSIPPWVALQRPFVWDEEQIARLFDSIMRGFPIGTVLIWRTDATVKHQNFVADWSSSIDATGADLPRSSGAKDIVLDGHQRLQSLLIGLAGSFSGRELHFDVTSGEAASPDGTRYRFGFKDVSVSWPWVRFKPMVGEMSHDQSFPVFQEDPTYPALSGARTEADWNLIVHNVQRAIEKFALAGDIRFQRLVRDVYERHPGVPDLYTAEEAAEIFRRINASGSVTDRLTPAFT